MSLKLHRPRAPLMPSVMRPHRYMVKMTPSAELPLIEVEVTFIPESEGGRHTPPTLVWSSGSYRPHVVIGDSHQRQDVMPGNEIQENYLGIVFIAGPSSVEFNKSLVA